MEKLFQTGQSNFNKKQNILIQLAGSLQAGQGLPPPTAEGQGFLRVSTPPGRCFPHVPPEPPGHNKTCTGPPVIEGLRFAAVAGSGEDFFKGEVGPVSSAAARGLPDQETGGFWKYPSASAVIWRRRSSTKRRFSSRSFWLRSRGMKIGSPHT